ncbi:hypothetical protein [Kitasatospora sp. NPDC001683]
MPDVRDVPDVADVADERAADVLLAWERLSARCGRAQAYWYGAQNDGSAVLAAERGVVVPRFGVFRVRR